MDLKRVGGKVCSWLILVLTAGCLLLSMRVRELPAGHLFVSNDGRVLHAAQADSSSAFVSLEKGREVSYKPWYVEWQLRLPVAEDEFSVTVRQVACHAQLGFLDPVAGYESIFADRGTTASAEDVAIKTFLGSASDPRWLEFSNSSDLAQRNKFLKLVSETAAPLGRFKIAVISASFSAEERDYVRVD